MIPWQELGHNRCFQSGHFFWQIESGEMDPIGGGKFACC
jgi:hypothetical protein